MTERREKILAYLLFSIMLVSLLPVVWLGRYNHPTGDDYYYGPQTHEVWEETGSLAATFREAAKGVGEEYQQWQGTYSAMFLMYLPPNIFSQGAYKWVTFVILLSLTGGIFYCLKPLICHYLGASVSLWMMVSSLLTLLCVETVPSQGETFFWYNGSMYYTGFLAVTLFFFGLLIRYLIKPGIGKVMLLSLLAAFLAGGNYVSLLPSLLILICMLPFLLWKGQKKQACAVAVVAFFMLAGLAVSALAPGNAVRQSGMDQISAPIAVLKSLRQGVRYLMAWIRAEWVIAVILLTPFVWRAMDKVSYAFSYPVIVLGFAYGIFCSMGCPTFYTMNSTGPARAVAIVYYTFMIYTFFSYFYLLGYIHRVYTVGLPASFVVHFAFLVVCIGLVFSCVVTGRAKQYTTVKAVTLLASGEAKEYEREHQERLAILNAPGYTDVVLPAFHNKPDMLYVGDFSPDPLEETNVKVAEFFNKKSVCVE